MESYITIQSIPQEKKNQTSLVKQDILLGKQVNTSSISLLATTVKPKCQEEKSNDQKLEVDDFQSRKRKALFKSTDSILIGESSLESPTTKLVAPRPDKIVVPQFRFGQGKTFSLNDEVQIEGIKREHNQKLRRSVIATGEKYTK